MWVSPFRYLRIVGYLLLPTAFRSLSRLSSALSAKASTLRSFLLNLVTSFSHNFLRALLYSVTKKLAFLFHCFFFYRYAYLNKHNASDVSSFFFKILSIFGFQGTTRIIIFNNPMETERFELLTPCLQGRCSPN